MQYETAARMAERLGVTSRMVQIWAKEGKLHGAVKQGRDWLIPVGTERPGKNSNNLIKKQPLPLIDAIFEHGRCFEYIESITDEELKKLAMAEYYYFSGQMEKAIEYTEEFFNYDDNVVKLSVYLINAFSNAAMGNYILARESLENMKKIIHKDLNENLSFEVKAIYILLAATASELMDMSVAEEDLLDYIKYLPEGLKSWACQVMSYSAYLRGHYNEALGMIEITLSLNSGIYPITRIYMHLSAAMSYMGKKKIEEAKKHFYDAWELAKADGFFEIFAEQHGLLYGLSEICIKDEYPDEYEKIIGIANRFNKTKQILKDEARTGNQVEELTSAEMVISMLVSKGWSNQEIADYMNLSVNTVKRYISIIYQKLAVTKRSELKKYML